MLFPPTTSFTALSTIPLPTPHVLHPKACNPSMDLIVLLSPPASASTATSSSSAATAAPSRVLPAYQAWNSAKGKGKDTDTGVSGGGQKTEVSLWRTGGSRVWEVDVAGRVAGLAWSEDGLVLSILLINTTGNSIEHLCVHTGELIRSIPLDEDLGHLGLSGDEAGCGNGRWVNMEWRSTGVDWQEPKNGSALMIIDSLPRVTPVEPPKPTNLLPFQRPKNTAPVKPTIHSSLSTFPSLLPSDPPISAHVLTISNRSFLTGTFPLSTLPSASPDSGFGPSSSTMGTAVLDLAKVSDRMAGLLNVVLRGLENAEQAFRDGEKQTMICREDLETCAQQQAMTIPDVHADLFRFLMTGRSGIAVNEWLGNRLTGRTITKWDQMLDTSFRTIQRLISQSISPALERLVLLLEEMKGWSRELSYKSQLNFDEAALSSAINRVLGFARLVERMRRDAEHEMLAAAEFMTWLRYDPSSDDLPMPTHDLKLVWSFMQNGFVESSFHRHFPNLPKRPPSDCLPDDYQCYPRSAVRKLEDILKETSERIDVHALHKARGGSEFGTPLTAGNGGDESNDSTASMSKSMSMSMSLVEGVSDGDHEGDITPTQNLSPTEDLDDLSRASSPDTVEQKDDSHPIDEGEIRRSIEVEPWVWANTLVRDLEQLIKSAVTGGEGSGPAKGNGEETGLSGLRDIRRTNEGKWEALSPAVTGVQQLWLKYTSGPETKLAGFTLSDSNSGLNGTNAQCLALQFFDDEELVLLLQSTTPLDPESNGGDVEMDSPRYLVTMRYADLLLDREEEGEGDGEGDAGEAGAMSDLPPELGNSALGQLVQMGQSSLDALSVLPISRCRQISSDDDDCNAQLALNGRKGRRLGCVIQEEGTEIQVWDLDVNEDDDDEGEEEEEDGEEDEDMGHTEGEGGEEEVMNGVGY
ncbi:hypothetical protein I317_04844 [Kwoniella heveanensis CBS 569]|nr:hypothetical protein I317_04844 [Kwoniella heveanensis CBS 569]